MVTCYSIISTEICNPVWHQKCSFLFAMTWTLWFKKLNASLYLSHSAYLPSQHLLVIWYYYFPQVFSELDKSDESSVSSATKISTKPGSKLEPQTDPTSTMLRNMDAVSRAATLRNYIDMIESLDALSRNNCLWLFALCVAIHTPLDAETCASLRSLLRKCATILATKTEMDNEVVMLNILMTISGRYFGQCENNNWIGDQYNTIAKLHSRWQFYVRIYHICESCGSFSCNC